MCVAVVVEGGLDLFALGAAIRTLAPRSNAAATMCRGTQMPTLFNPAVTLGTNPAVVNIN